MINLEEEIKIQINRIKTKESTLEKDAKKINSDVVFYTNTAWILVFIGFVVLVICTFYSYMNDKDFNAYGDFIGGCVGTFWTLASVFFIYVAFLGQKIQLNNQQIEILYNQLDSKHTQKELFEQKKEFRKQNETLEQQKFENTFFQLISMYNNIVNSMDLGSGDTIKTGRDCFKRLYDEFQRTTKSIKRNKGTSGKISHEEMLEGYTQFYTTNMADLSHYFRTVYHILKFIETSEIDNKKRYASFIRSQLSSYEQILIFYNCLHSNGFEKFKPLIEKYELFKNIDNSLILSTAHKSKYDSKAFANNA